MTHAKVGPYPKGSRREHGGTLRSNKARRRRDTQYPVKSFWKGMGVQGEGGTFLPKKVPPSPCNTTH